MAPPSLSFNQTASGSLRRLSSPVELLGSSRPVQSRAGYVLATKKVLPSCRLSISIDYYSFLAPVRYKILFEPKKSVSYPRGHCIFLSIENY